MSQKGAVLCISGAQDSHNVFYCEMFSVLMVTILAKIYSDEEIERLSKNPCVYYVCRNRLSLTLEFRQQMYDVWLQKPAPSTIRKLLLENGFNPNELGKDFYKSISRTFKDYGRPQRVKEPSYKDENVKYHTVPEKQEKKGAADNRPDSEEPERGQATGRDSLIRSGKLIMDGKKISIAPDYVTALFSSYPEISVCEALSVDGLTVSDIGKTRIRRLEEMFSECLAAGTAPFESRDTGSPLAADEIAAALKNPFVEAAAPPGICMREGFGKAAAALRGMPVDHVLDIFMLGHRNFTLPEKTRIKELLDRPSPDLSGTGAFGGTVYDARILRRRLAALEMLAGEGFRKISELAAALKPCQKKQVCLWVKGLPPDPGHVFTRKEILMRIGITRSAYYQYIGDPGFGMGELRRKERDEADARLVKMAADYKGFRKGSRLICMLLERLTGRRIGLKKIRRIMKDCGMECGIRRQNPSNAGERSYEKEAVKPNLLRRRFRLYRPNKVRVTDVTYLDYGDKKRAYGSALMDPVTGRLVAFVVSEKNNLEMALETLRASDAHPCEDGGIFHSDQGALYKSGTFQKEVLEKGLEQSMSKKGNCWDNATQESFFGHFKDECSCSSCADFQELKKSVEEYSWYYNNERGMWDKGRMTPAEYEEYLLGLDEEQFGRYLAAEEKKYDEMRERAAELAKKRYGTLGV